MFPGSLNIPFRGPLLAAASAVVVLLALAVVPNPAAASPLTCTGTAENAVGAHAGSLSSRVGLTLDCDAAASFEVILPGGAQSSYDTDADGHFMGTVGDAYVCSGHPAQIAVIAHANGEEWRGLLPFEQAPQAPDTNGPGPECDALMHPEFNYVTYQGALATPEEAFADSQFTAVIPFGANESLNGSEHVLAVFEPTPENDGQPADWTFKQWRPGAPTFVNNLDFLVPGHTYVIMTDAELAWVFPQ